MSRLAPSTNAGSVLNGVLPTPKIRNVSLKLSPLPPPINNPHIDHEREAIIYTDRAGHRKFKHPGFSVQKDPRNLLVEVTVVLFDRINDNGISKWFTDEDLMKYLRLQVIHCEDPNFTKAINERNFTASPSEVNKFKKNDGRVRTEIVSLQADSAALEQFYNKSEDGGRQLLYKFNFAVSGTTPKHLTYFANVYIDMDQLINDYGLDIAPSAKTKVVSDTTVEAIYKDSRLIDTAIMYTSNGDVVSSTAYRFEKELIPAEILNDEIIAMDLIEIAEAILSPSRGTKKSQLKTKIQKIVMNYSEPKARQLKKLIDSTPSNPKAPEAPIRKRLQMRYDRYREIVKNSRKLTQKVVLNPTIRDERTVQQLSDIQITIADEAEEEKPIQDLRPIDSGNNTVSNQVASNVKNSLYFSDSYIARGTDNSARIMFLMDFNKMVQKNSKYSALLKNTTPSIAAVLRSKVRLESIKITRMRVDDEGVLNQHDTSMTRDREAIKQVVATGMLNRKLGTIQGDLRETSSKKKKNVLLGSLKETTLVGITNKDMRAFEVVDYAIADRQAGQYIYRAELNLIDEIGGYLVSKAAELFSAKEKLKEYYNISTMKCHYDIELEKFTEFFIGTLYKKYGLSNPDTILALDNEGVNRLLTTTSPLDAPWMRPVSKYVEILNLFGNISDSDGFTLATKMYANVEPSTASPDTILEVIKQFEELETKISDVLGITQTQLSSYNKSRSNIAKSLSKTIPIIYDFKNKLDNKTLNNIGAQFLQFGNQQGRGLTIIDRANFAKRFKKENVKFFRNQPQRAANALNDMGTYQYSYLSPSFVRVGGQTLSLIDRGESLFDPDQYQDMAFSISLLKTNPAARSMTMPVFNSYASSDMVQSSKSSVARSGINSQALQLLANYGISFAPPSPANSQQAYETLAPLLEVKELLGENTLFAIENAIRTEKDDGNVGQTPPLVPSLTNTQVAEADATLFASSLMSTLVNIGQENFGGVSAQGKQVASFNELDKEEIEFSKTLDFYDLTNPKNGVDSKMRTRLGSSSEANIRKIPNQLKSLFLTKAGQATPNKNWYTMETDPMADPSLRPLFEMLYFNLQKIEVLVGYNNSPEDIALLRSPKWQLLTEDMFTKNGRLLCRLSKYQNDLLHVGQTDVFELPVYNSYFILDLSDRKAKTNPNPVVRGNLYSAGGEFETSNGTNYIGNYHIHKDGTVMTGADMGPNEEVLVPIESTTVTKNTAARKLVSQLVSDDSGYQKKMLEKMVSNHYDQVGVISEYCNTSQTIPSPGQDNTYQRKRKVRRDPATVAQEKARQSNSASRKKGGNY